SLACKRRQLPVGAQVVVTRRGLLARFRATWTPVRVKKTRHVRLLEYFRVSMKRGIVLAPLLLALGLGAASAAPRGTAGAFDFWVLAPLVIQHLAPLRIQ
ncbi:hypothetical protein J8J40_25375, partial [Mycobacterium tuberculosis]|nr:hypothetical protein [Mycobacterium tuberculosis]